MDIAKEFHPLRSKYFVFTYDIILPIIIFIFVCLGLYLIFFSPFFQIQTVRCQVDYTDCTSESLIAETQKIIGQNIFLYSASRITTRLKSGDFTIREVVMTKDLPSTIRLNLQSVYPVLAISSGSLEFVVLDSSYRVIAVRREDPNVPTLLISTPLTFTIGQKPSNEQVLSALKFIDRLRGELYNIKTLKLVDDSVIEVLLPSGITAIMSPQKDESIQIKALQVILADDTITKGVRTIDVRLSQPVLR